MIRSYIDYNSITADSGRVLNYPVPVKSIQMISSHAVTLEVGRSKLMTQK